MYSGAAGELICVYTVCEGNAFMTHTNMRGTKEAFFIFESNYRDCANLNTYILHSFMYGNCKLRFSCVCFLTYV